MLLEYLVDENILPKSVVPSPSPLGQGIIDQALELKTLELRRKRKGKTSLDPVERIRDTGRERIKINRA